MARALASVQVKLGDLNVLQCTNHIEYVSLEHIFWLQSKVKMCFQCFNLSHIGKIETPLVGIFTNHFPQPNGLVERCEKALHAHGAQTHLNGVLGYLDRNPLIHIASTHVSYIGCPSNNFLFFCFNFIPILLSLLFWLSLLVSCFFRETQVSGSVNSNIWEKPVGTAIVAPILWKRPVAALNMPIYRAFSKHSSVLFFTLLQLASVCSN